MKIILKCMFSVFLAVVMLLSGTPLSEFIGVDLSSADNLLTLNAEAAGISGSDGNNIDWSLDINTGVLKISGNGEMSDSLAMSAWYYYRHSIKTVVIEKGVTSISYGAFADCYNLTSIIIPEGVTAIGYKAFYDCTGLTDIYLPNSIKSIGDGAFEGCVGLTSVILPDGIKSIGESAFSGCANLTSINLPDSLESIGRYALSSTAFYSNLSDYDADGIIYVGKHLIKSNNTVSGEYKIKSGTKTIYGDVFYDSANLSSVIIPNSVVSIGVSAFRRCSSITSVIIPDSVMTIGGCAFADCTSLADITIPNTVANIESGVFSNTAYYNNPDNYDDYGVLYIGNYLVDTKGEIVGEYKVKSGTKTICSWSNYNGNITNLTIPDSVENIGEYAFSFGKTIDKVSIGRGLKNISANVFENSKFITVDEDNPYFSSDEHGVLFNKDKTILIQYPSENARTSYEIPDTVVSIGAGAFYGCKNLTDVIIPSSVINIEDKAFYSSNITTLNIPYGVVNIGMEVFCECEELESVTISDSVINIGAGAFFGGTKLDTVEIPSSVVNIGESAFVCYADTISVDENNAHYSSDEYGVLFNKDKTLLLQCPIDIKQTEYVVPDGVKWIGDEAFFCCSSLTNVILPNTVVSIGRGAFFWCRNLLNINIPNGVTDIGEEAFSGCRSFTEIIIPNSVTKIELNIFQNCYNLASITIPRSVVIIESAFLSCSNLKDVYYGGSKSDREKILISDSYGNEYLLSATWHYDTHICEYTTFSHYQAEAPHYAVYRCSCGAEKAFDNEMLGDIGNDGKINSTDALLVLQAAVDKISLSEKQKRLCDINRDGSVNSTDALMILQYSVGKINKF